RVFPYADGCKRRARLDCFVWPGTGRAEPDYVGRWQSERAMPAQQARLLPATQCRWRYAPMTLRLPSHARVSAKRALGAIAGRLALAAHETHSPTTMSAAGVSGTRAQPR